METNTTATAQTPIVPETTTPPATPPAEGQTPPAEKPPENPKVASRFAQLSRQEKEVRDQRNALKAEQDAWNAEKAELQQLKELKARAKQNPHEYLKAAEIDLDYLVQYSLNDNKQPVDKRIEELEAKIDKRLTEKEEREKAEREEARKARQAEIWEQKKAETAATLDAFAQEIAQTVNSDPEKHEVIIAEGKQNLVYELIVDHYNRTCDPETGLGGEILDVATVAEKLEEELVKEKIERAKSSPKVQRELAKAFGVPVPGEKIVLPQRQVWQNPVRTLSNSQVESNPVVNKARTKDERMAAAMQKLTYIEK